MNLNKSHLIGPQSTMCPRYKACVMHMHVEKAKRERKDNTFKI